MSIPPFLPTPSAEGVENFRELYKARFGQDLTEEQARDLAARYLLVYELGTTKVDKIAPLTTMKSNNS